ncbi:unnamed protein product [Hymenolepis diminuta]|uniref:Uncharacterized protein n=1 Tax=Hymenolepis diminuta TaxID=6216 RepID=A0A564YW65_HYMDI|nr:unnamed protein product [Hymenolepis diminuta]
MSKRTYQFLLSVTSSFHLKSTSALIFSLILTQMTHIKLSSFPTQKQCTLASYRLLRFLLISSLPQHLPLSIYLSLCHSYQTRCGFLEYILA